MSGTDHDTRVERARAGVSGRPSFPAAARDPAHPYIRIEGVWKSYDGRHDVLQDLDLVVYKGEFLTLLGPSGSGKTTTLMILAGFEDTSRGRILLDGRVIDGVPPYRRNIGVVFQNYALFPNMTVGENLAFPLRARKLTPRQIRDRIQESLRMVRMQHLADRYPAQLSGGQQQRVALARATIFEPLLVLMDEPLGALDKQLRDQMQEELKELHALTSSTIVYVTHDQGEALHMSDRIAVFNDGRIEQIGTPREIYGTPATRFVAEFIGETNWLEGEVIDADAGRLRVKVAGGELLACSGPAGHGPGQRVTLAVRPESVKFEEEAGEPSASLEASITDVTYLGHNTKVKLALPDRTTLTALATRHPDPAASSDSVRTRVWIGAKDIIVFPTD